MLSASVVFFATVTHVFCDGWRSPPPGALFSGQPMFFATAGGSHVFCDGCCFCVVVVVVVVEVVVVVVVVVSSSSSSSSSSS